ncbi:hypothetical protein [Chengkuizengella sediminis]|uniref:hypothetical protein n=1 Tax=Chengkuizengella sediminis TaxID=1885917 RepID=UPI00138A5681|nr:hypothetical protein [Chengkuizengella sediminis]NDI33442.1 hypothetical protein [Chengkuizengella sediminis]
MGLKKEPFVVAETFSVLDPYDPASENIIVLSNDGDFEIVATVDVCVKQPQRTQVSLDSFAQIAVEPGADDDPQTFEVTYELLRNGDPIVTIDDEMDYVHAGTGRHTNFPNFPLVDNNPSAGINRYDLVCTRISGPSFIFVASRSLKATVFTLTV